MNTTEILTLEDGLKACKRSFTAVGVFSGVANLLMLVPAFFMLNVYDKAVAHNSISTLWVLSGITAFMYLMLMLLEILRSRILVAVSSRLDQLLSPKLYESIFDHAVKKGTGSKSTTQPLRDLAGLRQFLTGQPIFAVFDAPWLPVYIVILFLFHPLLGWMGVVAAAVFFLLAIGNEFTTTATISSANSLALKADSDTQHNLKNSEAVAAMGFMPALKERWRSDQDDALALQESASNAAGIFSGVIKTLRMAVQSAAIGAGAYLVLLQEISPGMIIAGSILIGRALQPVEMAVGAWQRFAEAKNQYSRVQDMLETAAVSSVNMSLPDITGAISASEASITPPGASRPTLEGVSFSLPAGSTCMVLGSSGAGKSTLVRGVLGLWPTGGGKLRLDGADAFQYTRQELGPQVGYLPQAIELLEGSISANITRFSEVDADSVVQAAKDAGVHEFILALPDGYDTEIGRQGGMLSPGQRQRIALARALYKRPKLVVLDEPNSNLDDSGEAALYSAIETLKEGGSTVLIVSHRQGVLPLADYLLVLGGGGMVDFGPVQPVLERFKHLRASHSQSDKVDPSQKASLKAISWGARDESAVE